MRIITAAVARAVIDAGILAATYPGHDPARWALPLLDQLDARATGWQLVELDTQALAGLWLPPHSGEACHGDSISLGDEGGSSVIQAHDWLIAHADAYAAANPSCWGRIKFASKRPMSPLVVSAASVGDRVKPEQAELVVVDGLHRALGFWMAGERHCQAYAPVLDRALLDGYVLSGA
ncbi:hypothetical protein LuPra_06066 [Luteitalea pratensis]|uniref:Uncharacterized protein n=1 Tax=Luteitalea pratensis TaxID=1855912 RepID=A0A143PY76_LUTPR|nr:DUF6309 family protein [Luteitalea pratensis]AMY12784.1 hypothetical protein LuPra_06066 [Luteitalea pratensis]